MSLTQALSTALSGLNVTQTGIAVVAANVANANTPGYVTKTAVQISTVSGEVGTSVRVATINRELDQFVQQQLRTETSGGAYADLRSSFYGQLQNIYGQPGSSATLDALFSGLTSAVQTLATSPDASAARAGVLGAAQALAQQLNGITNDIQGLRSRAEQGIAATVQQANTALAQIARINQQLAVQGTNDNTAATLMDERDRAIDTLARLTDIKVVMADHNQVKVFTGSGYQLAGADAVQLAFDQQGTITASQHWDADPGKRAVGTITLVSSSGGVSDLISAGGIRSGELAAYLEMRDRILVQAQNQVDELAAQMSRALSDRTIPGTAVTLPAGFDIDVGGVLPGNTIELTYAQLPGGTQHKITLVRVDDPAALPLADAATTEPNDRVIGVDFSGGLASVIAQLNTQLGPAGLQFANPAGSTLRVAGSTVANVLSGSATVTTNTLTGGVSQLPLFLDGNVAFSGAITAGGAQIVGFAGRIVVNAGLIADPSKLVAYQLAPPVSAGDATRPNFIYDQLTRTTRDFSPATGIGAASAPFKGTLASYVAQVVSQQSQAAVAADNLKQGQEVVVNALKLRFEESAAVNIDVEMSHLLALQTAYGANARVMTTVKQMLDLLLQM